jgi:hypothetical protein
MVARFVQTIAVELEGGAADARDMTPVDSLVRFGSDMLSTGRKFEGVTADMSRWSLEKITRVCRSGAQVRESLDRVGRLMPKDVVPIFKPRPFPGRVPIVGKPRAAVMYTALKREHRRGGLGIATVAPWCAMHMHIGVPTVCSDEAVLFQNVLNNIAPYARQIVIRRYRIQGAAGHLMIWKGWCNPDRTPAPRWFTGIEHYKSFLGTVPKLVLQVGGQWRPGDGTFSKLGDPDSEGTIWHVARLRGMFDTIEWRPFPSMPEVHIPPLVDKTLVLADAFWDYVAGHPEIVGGQIGEMHGLYRSLNRVCKLVPARPLSRAEWWKLYKL